MSWTYAAHGPRFCTVFVSMCVVAWSTISVQVMAFHSLRPVRTTSHGSSKDVALCRASGMHTVPVERINQYQRLWHRRASMCDVSTNHGPASSRFDYDARAGIQRSSFSTSSTTRGGAIKIALSAIFAMLASAAQPSYALDPVKKLQELYRIKTQEQADEILGGGELASPEGGKTIQPILTLIPIVTLRLRLDMAESYLKDPKRFGDALAILQAQDFQKKDIKRVFNAYSDNIYYLPGSERENKYLQGGATPSSRQTLQYLLRNDVIDNVEALTAEIAYLIRERETSEAENAGKAYDSDEKDLRMYLAKCKEGFDRYLGMVYQNEIDEATEYAKMALASAKSQ